jgi:uroporphyrinogen decarboxylase
MEAGGIMDARGRVLAAFEHREPDRLPLDLGTSDTFIARGVCRALAQLMKVDVAGALDGGDPDDFVTPPEAMLEALGADVRLVHVHARPDLPSLPGSVIHRQLPDGGSEDIHANGSIFRRPAGKRQFSLYKPALDRLLDDGDAERLFPDVPTEPPWADAARARTEIAQCHAKGLSVQCNFILMPIGMTYYGPFDLAGWCVQLASDPARLYALMERALEQALARAEPFYDAVGAHMDTVYGLGDDVASQTGMWMSPADYRRYVKPLHARIIGFIKQRTQAKIIHHCCGACHAIIGDLIEIGVDALNPTQTSAEGMDPFELKKEFGKDMTFWGGIDVRHLLPKGSVQDVEREVKRHIDALAPGGGFIFAPSHIIQSDCRPENVLAMYRTALEYGRY